MGDFLSGTLGVLTRVPGKPLYYRVRVGWEYKVF